MIEEFLSSPNQTNKTKDGETCRQLLDHTSVKQFLYLTNVDHVPSSGTRSGSTALLHVFEDNEAVIKMIMKGRSPTMRHVSRTHRVTLDWLVDRINIDCKIQIRYFDTKHQLADILTKGNFTRDEWTNLLHLFNISHFSSLCCAQNFSLTSCPKTTAKRMQEQKEEDRIVAKSKPTAILTSNCLDKFLIREPSDCVEKPSDTQSIHRET